MNAVIYARYSSHNQKETSIDDQVRECLRYAEKEKLRVVGRYLDYEQSGRSDQREQFQQMLRDASRGLFEQVIVYELTRFARNKYESAINKYHLKKHGVRVVSATEIIPDSPEGVLIESLLEGIAEYQSLNLAKNFMRGKIGVAQQCKHTGGRPLLGYRVLPDKSYAIDEDNAAAVRLLYQMYAEGSGYSEIIDTLNSRGHRTAAGRSFGKNSLHELLKNERYIGTYTFNKTAPAKNGRRSSRETKSVEDIVRIENGIPAIIDKATWERVQKRMEANKKAPAKHKANVNYLLTGKIFCGTCKGAMVGQPSTSKSGVYHYYTCCTKKRLRTCDKRNVKKEWIEEQVLHYLRTFLTEDITERIAEMAVRVQLENNDQKREIARMNKRIQEIQVSLKNINDAIEQGIFSSETKDRIEALEGERDTLEAAIDLARYTDEILITKEGVAARLNNIKDGDDQTLIDYLLKAVYVYENKVLIFCNYEDDDGKKVDIEEVEMCADKEGVELSAPC